jgi:iron uptake system component EfeO
MTRRTRTTALIIPLLAALVATASACSSDADAGDAGTDPAAAPTVPSTPQTEAAVRQYEAYVTQQVDQLVAHTQQFAGDYQDGRDAAARAAYAPARVYWERIEPVAEAFGEIDPRLDLREADLEAGQDWTGWHAIEKDLWPPASGYTPLDDERRTYLATRLVSDTDDLKAMTSQMSLTPLDLSDGAKALLDEIATGKVTGEEEAWSHTDLWDFKANLDGAKAAYVALRPAVKSSDPDLVATLDERFAATEQALAQHAARDASGKGGKGGYVSYDSLSPTQVEQLAASVEALSEPLAQLSASLSEPSS